MGLITFILQKQQQMITINEQGLIDDKFIADIFGQIIERILESDTNLIKERKKENERMGKN